MAKLNFSTRMFLPAAVLILLSGGTVADEAKSCYWCGPLAEQVHRSQRAPSCGQVLQETICDKGYTHCAIIATSPPYVESRLCVKFYQDECYSLYCNSSKTWRMICPCQGNLCNSQNTDRETTAFATLAKIVGKDKRTKRSLIGAKGFLSISPRQVMNETTIIVLSANSTTHSAVQSDQPIDKHFEIIHSTTMNHNDALDKHDGVNEDKNIEKNIIEQEDSEMQGDQPIKEQIKPKEAAATTGNNKNVADVKHSETTKAIEEEIITTAMTISSNNDMTTNNDNKNIFTVTEVAELVKESHPSMMPTSIEIEVSVVPNQNSKDNMPPPEALQQNVTPIKVSASTATMGSVEMSTNEKVIETTTHSLQVTVKKNVQKEMVKSGEKPEKYEKNGEEQTIAHLGELVILMIILIYFTF